jgi:hypothetical protein
MFSEATKGMEAHSFFANPHRLKARRQAEFKVFVGFAVREESRSGFSTGGRLLEDQNCWIGIALRNGHELRWRDHVNDDLTASPGSDRHRSPAIGRRGGDRVSGVEGHARIRPARGADIFRAGHSAGGADIVPGKLAGENRHSIAHRISCKASVRAFQRDIGKRLGGLWLADAKQNIDVGDEEEHMIRVH